MSAPLTLSHARPRAAKPLPPGRQAAFEAAVAQRTADEEEDIVLERLWKPPQLGERATEVVLLLRQAAGIFAYLEARHTPFPTPLLCFTSTPGSS